MAVESAQTPKSRTQQSATRPKRPSSSRRALTPMNASRPPHPFHRPRLPSPECSATKPPPPTAHGRQPRNNDTTSRLPTKKDHLAPGFGPTPSSTRPGFWTRNWLVSPFPSPIKTSPNPTHRLVATLARRTRPPFLSPLPPFSSSRSLHAPFLPFKTFASS
jgi:hypothetical protein